MIKDLIQNKTASEIIDIKVTEICKLDFVGDYSNVVPGLDIKILSIEKIKDGISIFAQAWRNGEQIGFGKDGSIDIERFRIFNPPILVRDPNGTEITLDKDGNVLRKLRKSERRSFTITCRYNQNCRETRRWNYKRENREYDKHVLSPIWCRKCA